MLGDLVKPFIVSDLVIRGQPAQFTHNPDNITSCQFTCLAMNFANMFLENPTTSQVLRCTCPSVLKNVLQPLNPE